jgi:hypothetical protein
MIAGKLMILLLAVPFLALETELMIFVWEKCNWLKVILQLHIVYYLRILFR